MTAQRVLIWVGCWALIVAPGERAWAEAVSLQGQNAFLQGRGALYVSDGRASDDGRSQIGSLFAGQQSGSLFAPVALRIPAAPLALTGATRIDRLRHLISQAESRQHGYDAVQHGARIRPDKLPTQMTLAEIYDWIDATPGQPHAIGRYQFIPATLRRVVVRAGLSETDMFTPAIQDRLGDELLSDAGLAAFKRGQIGRHRFMNNLAEIWAGLPTESGLSHYDGIAGNRAAISWADFDLQMAQIFPDAPVTVDG